MRGECRGSRGSGRESILHGGRSRVGRGVSPVRDRVWWVLVVGLSLASWGCSPGNRVLTQGRESLVNFRHLDHLLEVVEREGAEVGIVHIYAEAPDYAWVEDDDEGAAAVDDAARAAVVFLRHFELTGSAASRSKAEALIRFIRYMQTESGLFYNFVWDSELTINKEHQNSRADEVNWWTARSIWALGRCAEVLRDVNPELSQSCLDSAAKTYPALQGLARQHGKTFTHNGRTYPEWLIYASAADATSELMLGLLAIERAHPNPTTQELIARFAEGIQMMQFGDAVEFPFGAHASWIETWHAWGNAQSQALAEAGLLEGPRLEAEAFYPRLLIDGWLHSIDFTNPDDPRRFEQIAYGVRGVALGLLELYDATRDERYAKLAGLAASWFTGNNVAGAAMYDPETGRGFDGIQNPDDVNYNAGAESTIEALYTIMEIEQRPAARAWLYARGDEPHEAQCGGKRYLYRIFHASRRASEAGRHSGRLAVVLNLTDQEMSILEGRDLDAFLR